jgi:predicted O-methyltransferase YrrM
VSTVVLARLMRERGGRITSLEHEPDWLRVVGSQLERERLSPTSSRLVHAPLESHPRSYDSAPWYANHALDELPATGIDLLLVDGPPGYGGGMERSRYPALPELAGRLAPGALVVLDDAGRPGEQQILARWQRELPEWSFSLRAESGIAVGCRART